MFYLFDELVLSGSFGDRKRGFELDYDWGLADSFEVVDNSDDDSLQAQFPRVMFAAVDVGKVVVSELSSGVASSLILNIGIS